MSTAAPPAPSRTTTRGTPCAISWDDAWVAQVEAREQAMDRRICGARTGSFGQTVRSPFERCLWAKRKVMS